MAKYYNGAGHACATPGTGTLTLGAALPGYITFAGAGVANADVVPYTIIDANGGFEHGIGTYTASGTTLSRDTVRRSSGAGNTAKISLSASSKVYLSVGAEDFANLFGFVLSGGDFLISSTYDKGYKVGNANWGFRVTNTAGKFYTDLIGDFGSNSGGGARVVRGSTVVAIFDYDGTGKVGIGDDTPDHTFDVAGNIGVSAGGYYHFGDTTGSSGYGIRDNSGVIETKNSGGGWLPLRTVPLFTRYTTAGSGNHTVTGTPLYLIARWKAGGGGGGSTGTGDADGGAGGDSSFNSVTASGGVGGGRASFGGNNAGNGTGTGTAFSRTVGQAGLKGTYLGQGGDGGGSGNGRGGANSVAQAGTAGAANSGAGGGGASNAGVGYSAGGGSEGELARLKINNPTGSYAFVVGAAGAAGAAGTAGFAGGAGGVGYVEVEEYYQ